MEGSAYISCQYRYDALDRVTSMEYSDSARSGVFESYALEYDKNGNLISQETSANNAATTESETKAYSYDPNNMMTGCVISQDGTVSVDQTCIYNGDGQRTYKADGEDNTRLDDAGAVAASYTYSDFGETTANNVTAGDGTTDEPSEFYNEICYTGGIYDESTGEYYLNARYYDPSDGRFTTQDSYRGENTDEGTWNLYTYCANSPLIHVDPSGHKRKDISKKLDKTMKKNAKKLYKYAINVSKVYSYVPNIGILKL